MSQFHRVEDRRFIGEKLIQGANRSTGLSRDHMSRGSVIPDLAEHQSSGIQDFFDPLFTPLLFRLSPQIA